jgi:hypothetical protein
VSAVDQRVKALERKRKQNYWHIRRALSSLEKANALTYAYREAHPAGTLFGWDAEYQTARATDMLRNVLQGMEPININRSNP